MTSPITIALTPTTVIPINRRRNAVYFQNTGTNAIYLKKINPGVNPIPIVSPTNYDMVIQPKNGDDLPLITKVETISGFTGITTGVNGSLAVMEVVNV